jgi:hypothetical protein
MIHRRLQGLLPHRGWGIARRTVASPALAATATPPPARTPAAALIATRGCAFTLIARLGFTVRIVVRGFHAGRRRARRPAFTGVLGMLSWRLAGTFAARLARKQTRFTLAGVAGGGLILFVFHEARIRERPGLLLFLASPKAIAQPIAHILDGRRFLKK